MATQKTSGTAIVSKGTMRVASTSERMMLLPLHRMRAMAKPIMELTTSPRTTMATVTTTELRMKRPAGTRSKTPA